MMKYAADPEGEQRRSLQSMVRGTVGDGSDTSKLVYKNEPIVLQKGNNDHIRASAITKRVLTAATKVIEGTYSGEYVYITNATICN